MISSVKTVWMIDTTGIEVIRLLWYLVPTLVEMRPKSLHVTGMFLACNMQGFGTFAMHVCMLCACNMHTTCRDFECFQYMLHMTCIQHYCDMHVSLNMHGSCMHMHITCKKFPLGKLDSKHTEVYNWFFECQALCCRTSIGKLSQLYYLIWSRIPDVSKSSNL